MEALTRQEMITILSAMNVDIPARTKLPDESLDKRLRRALEAAQYLSTTFKDKDRPLNPSSMTVWTGGSVLKASGRGNMDEAVLGLDLDAFMYLRSTVALLFEDWDDGSKRIYLTVKEAKDKLSDINIRFLSVHAPNKKTPMISLLYQVITRDNYQVAIDWVKSEPGDIRQLSVTPLEQKMMLKLLETNSKLLSPEYKPDKYSAEATFKPSFLLPIGPLTFEDVGHLNSETRNGCVLCGKRTASKCAQCQTVSYCGKDCQTAHWPEHKLVCRSIKGGTWRAFSFGLTLPGLEGAGMFTSFMNKLNRADDDNAFSPTQQITADSPPPPDIHGAKPFLVKVQKGAAMLVYDRQRSLSVYVGREKQPANYDALEDQMRTGYRGLKVYRWAKRTGDWELTICLEKGPVHDPKW